ncbi:YlaH-like family protein [Ornithinibacillus californiensis]|uniref:YlaH-like family protein n=1 Tax=Ornithinibacillus californiensis TaxID=161536 RepID=UPI00064DBD28|nr:YlaH-like family protein [Ornithinibacillus californiensis]
MVYDLVMERFGVEQVFNILYIVNLVLAAFAYKLGFAKRLPILKSVVVYALLAVGIFILNILFIILPATLAAQPLPMTESLVVICVVLAIYRVRLFIQRQAKKA